jgi:hypothetical protein
VCVCVYVYIYTIYFFIVIYIGSVFTYVKEEISYLQYVEFPAYSFCYGLIMAVLWAETCCELKRVLNDFGQSVELYKVYSYDRHANGDVLY